MACTSAGKLHGANTYAHAPLAWPCILAWVALQQYIVACGATLQNQVTKSKMLFVFDKLYKYMSITFLYYGSTINRML
eukprot:scaffold6360_cov219-Skeletonema_menzelii.AAC.2